MTQMTERDKVRLLVRQLKEEVAGTLVRQETGEAIGEVKVLRRGFGSELGRPDILVVIELDLKLLGTNVHVKTPILVELEDAGLAAARDDWDLFFERDHLEIPMLVVGRPGAQQDTKHWSSNAKVEGEVKFIGFKEESRSGNS